VVDLVLSLLVGGILTLWLGCQVSTLGLLLSRRGSDTRIFSG